MRSISMRVEMLIAARVTYVIKDTEAEKMRKAYCPTETRYYSSRGWILISYGRKLIAFSNYLIRTRGVLNSLAQCVNPNKYVFMPYVLKFRFINLQL